MANKILFPIIFFEESPFNKENQEKAKFLDFPAIIFLSAKSLKEFYFVRKEYLKVNSRIEVAWWPTFKTIWLSPFTPFREIEEFIHALKNIKPKKERLKILLDLELPFLRPHYFLLGLNYFQKSKKLIKKILEESGDFNVEIYTFEYPPNFLIFPSLLEKLGLTFLGVHASYKRILSCYTSSTFIFLRPFEKKAVIRGYKESKRETFVALGLLAPGRFRLERFMLITPDGLRKDLEYFLRNKVQRFAFFRLGGLNQDFLKIIKLFINF